MVEAGFFGSLAAYRGTFAATLDASTTGHWINARTRGFDTSVAAAINNDHLPPAIYTTLVAAVEWAYIPHFYYNFYVYQYSTSIAASSLLAEDVLAKKPGAVERYLTLLKAGGSDEPYTLLKTAGVDMATPAPYDAIARRMDSLMDQIEAIEAKKAKADAKKKKK